MVHVLCLRPSRVAQEGHELCMAYWGVSTPGYSLASSPVRVVESFPAQHSSERIRSSVADGSLGKISPLLLLVIMSGLSMGEGMVVWWVWLSACVCVNVKGVSYVCICD